MSKKPDRVFRVNFADLGFAMIEIAGRKIRIVVRDGEGNDTTGGVFLPVTTDPATIIERAKDPDKHDPHREARSLLSQTIGSRDPDEWQTSGLPSGWTFTEV